MAVLLILLMHNNLHAVDKIIYVSNKGTDTNQGERLSPLLTINEALRRAQRNEIIELAPGIYRESIKLNNVKDLTIRASRTGTVKINTSHLLAKKWKFLKKFSKFSKI